MNPIMAIEAKLDRYDMKLLKMFGMSFEFTKGSSQEARAYRLYVQGLLERKSEMYRMGAGGRIAEFRWAYRRTARGDKAAGRS